jgi:hypothetical protein
MVVNGICDGRLTLTSGTPVTTADVTAATTIYFTPSGRGSRIALYDGSAWAVYSFTELSISLGSDAANLPYDVFAYVSGGSVAIERLVWTSATARATALVLQNGVLVKSGAATRRYLGTYYTSAIGQTEDSATKRFVWNYYNRVERPLRKLEGTGTWTYTTAAWRQVNGSAANQVAAVIGVADVVVALQALALASNTNTGIIVATAIGMDSTSPHSSSVVGGAETAVVNIPLGISAQLHVYPAVGYHYFPWCEYGGSAGTSTWRGTNGVWQTGISGTVEG